MLKKKSSSILEFKGAIDKSAIINIDVSSDESEDEVKSLFSSNRKSSRSKNPKPPSRHPPKNSIVINLVDDDDSEMSSFRKRSKMETEPEVFYAPSPSTLLSQIASRSLSSQRSRLQRQFSEPISPNDKEKPTSKKDSLNLQFKNTNNRQDVEELWVHKKTPFQKILNEYASKRNLDPLLCTLKYDCNSIELSQTPEDLFMSKGDVVDVLIEDLSLEVPQTTPNTQIKLKVLNPKDKSKPLKFMIARNAKLQVLFKAFAEQMNIPLTSVHLTFDGDPINPEKTPDDYDLDDEDLLDS